MVAAPNNTNVNEVMLIRDEPHPVSASIYSVFMAGMSLPARDILLDQLTEPAGGNDALKDVMI